MEESFRHLTLQREETVTEKRSGRFRPPKSPDDPSAHAKSLKDKLKDAVTQTEKDEPGFDQRRLFRFTVEKGFDPDSLRNVSDEIEFVSQEGEEVVVAFVSSAALESFEAKLASMVDGKSVTYKHVLYSLRGIDGWSKEDRTGLELKREGFPGESSFLLDVELWPLEDNPENRRELWRAFEDWLQKQNIPFLDSVKQPGLSLYRVCCNHIQAERLLRHRDIRTVDLPPRFGMDRSHLFVGIQEFDDPPPPPDHAPGVVVLDSGLTLGHPLLKSAVSDSKSFLPGKDASDENGHGTHVAGLALYGDVEARVQERRFVPKLRLFSGRILDENNETNKNFVENKISEAVSYFYEKYGCKVFNLSFGDMNKPFFMGHVKGLAYTLDVLSRKFGVLFVVSAGNVLGNTLEGLDWKERYPDYLTERQWSIIEPAPALNALTVGSIARFDKTFASQRYATDPAEIPIARRDQPSPFTRCGPSVGGAIKPELVAYGGNWALNTRAGAYYLVSRNGLGEISTNMGFMGGNLFSEDSGTSMAAPHVAHLAASVLSEYPDADANLIRAMLLAHAAVPKAAENLVKDAEKLRRIYGYGKILPEALFRSFENEVSLIAQATMENKKHHFYEIPIPDVYTSAGRRTREITVSLAYTSYVRSTRITYKATRIDFKLVASPNLRRVTAMFDQATEKEDYENIPEIGNASSGGRVRGKGTVQAATWHFSQFNSRSLLRQNRLFVVITRNDFPWGEIHSATEEKYALVVCLRDRENQQARLYTKLRNRLRERAKAKVRR